MEAPGLDRAVAQRSPLALAEVSARGPADVAAARARSLENAAPRDARELVLLAAAKALDVEPLHTSCFRRGRERRLRRSPL